MGVFTPFGVLPWGLTHLLGSSTRENSLCASLLSHNHEFPWQLGAPAEIDQQNTSYKTSKSGSKKKKGCQSTSASEYMPFNTLESWYSRVLSSFSFWYTSDSRVLFSFRLRVLQVLASTQSFQLLLSQVRPTTRSFQLWVMQVLPSTQLFHLLVNPN